MICKICRSIILLYAIRLIGSVCLSMLYVYLLCVCSCCMFIFAFWHGLLFFVSLPGMRFVSIKSNTTWGVKRRQFFSRYKTCFSQDFIRILDHIMILSTTPWRQLSKTHAVDAARLYRQGDGGWGTVTDGSVSTLRTGSYRVRSRQRLTHTTV